MQIALFDTETTGLLKPSPAKLHEQPHIIELYACVINEEFQLLREFESFFSIPIPFFSDITKWTGITEDMLKGKPSFAKKYKELAKFFTGVDLIVAHNMTFDEGMLANELLRIHKLIYFPWPRYHVCTVEKSMIVRGHRLKLSDLHEILTGKGFEGAHRARNDVHALVRCFHALVEQKYINLQDYIN